ncbi:exonuclease SbcCD subunit D C-terminal domain-containing protein [Psychrobacter sp. HD31]|uniref:exonuclease SbcCD subunit D C-terminal domain-containing protein n=1 Tax=Psychrobacter sp. HD31 TaxID=3112003 RepID=UPI003DA2F4D2
MLKILHTSDWHLGRRLYGQTRYETFAAFLNWLYDCIVKQQIDVLIVAGDIFDSMTPSNKAQALYYEFLGRISQSGTCQHIIIVAGNHDSPSLLDAPKDVLKFLNVHIIGTACENIEEEVITLNNKNNEPQAIILAVPYLRDKDVRKSNAGESSTQKQSQVVAGITKHYAQATEFAAQKQNDYLKKYGKKVPLVATGHLMAIGGKTTSDDGVRDLYIGSLGGVSANMFDPIIDYVALGHLHVPQLVGGNEHIRYSGSPIPMGFGEANQQKQVLLIEFTDEMHIKPINIPTFQRLAQIKGDMDHITQQINQLKTLNEPVWIEVIYNAKQIVSNLSEQLHQLVQASDIEIIKINNTQTYQKILKQTEQSESLHDLSREDVFARCLETHDISEDQRTELMACFQEIVYEIEHDDVRAE